LGFSNVLFATHSRSVPNGSQTSTEDFLSYLIFKNFLLPLKKIIYKYIKELVGFPPVRFVAPWPDKLEASASSTAAAAASVLASLPPSSPIVGVSSTTASWMAVIVAVSGRVVFSNP
jgi:hypothetical protein